MLQGVTDNCYAYKDMHESDCSKLQQVLQTKMF